MRSWLRKRWMLTQVGHGPRLHDQRGEHEEDGQARDPPEGKGDAVLRGIDRAQDEYGDDNGNGIEGDPQPEGSVSSPHP